MGRLCVSTRRRPETKNEFVCSLRGRILFLCPVIGLWAPKTGVISLIILGVQILTSIVPVMLYVPTAEPAFNSVIHIIRAVRHGELLRNIHATGASLSFFVCYLYIFRGMYYNVHHEPWMTMRMISVMLYIPLMMTVFPGYSLI